MRHDLDLDDVPGVPALVGVAGSYAYGMSTTTSDVDYHGCYVVPTRHLFRLVTPPETYVSHDPVDISMHEAGKLLRLASGANPNALEALFLTDYVIQDSVGEMLLAHREMFLTNKIRDSHLGFAESQFKTMEKKRASIDPDARKRAPKYARHAMRVIRLTERVLTTGVYDLVEPDPDAVFAFSELEHSEMVRKAAREIVRVRELDSVLPEGPDMRMIDDLLCQIREMMLDD